MVVDVLYRMLVVVIASFLLNLAKTLYNKFVKKRSN